MGWIGPKGEDIPPHPRQEPRFEGDLTADHIRFIFRDCADLESGRSSSAGTRRSGPPSFSSTDRSAMNG